MSVKQVYTVHVNGVARYHGINKTDALEAIIAACNAGERVDVQRNPLPASTVKFQCCAGTTFHSSNCPVVR